MSEESVSSSQCSDVNIDFSELGGVGTRSAGNVAPIGKGDDNVGAGTPSSLFAKKTPDASEETVPPGRQTGPFQLSEISPNFNFVQKFGYTWGEYEPLEIDQFPVEKDTGENNCIDGADASESLDTPLDPMHISEEKGNSKLCEERNVGDGQIRFPTVKPFPGQQHKVEMVKPLDSSALKASLSQSQRKATRESKGSDSDEVAIALNGIHRDRDIAAVDLDSLLVYESLSTRIYLLSDEENRLGGRTGMAAIKTQVDGVVNSTFNSSFHREYTVSRHLTSFGCSYTRAALRFDSDDAFQAIYLEWIPGLTLREWIKLAHETRRMDDEHKFKCLARVACEIARALSDIHDANVVHNNIQSENIIVDAPLTGEDGISLTIIDLGEASIVDPTKSEREHRKDLASFASVLHEMFSGLAGPFLEDVSDGSEPTSGDVVKNFSEKSWLSSHDNDESTYALRNSVPTPVSPIISKLTKNLPADGYKSAKDLEIDLLLLLSNSHCLSMENSIKSSSTNSVDQEPNVSALSYTNTEKKVCGDGRICREQVSKGPAGAHLKKTIDSRSLLVYESPTSRIYCLSDAQNTFGGRTGAVAIKTLAEGPRDPGQISRLYDEYILTRHLKSCGCASIRAALRHDREDGFQAIYLEWAPGETLREWIRSIESTPALISGSAYLKMVRLAWEITRAVSDMHDAGVIHNNINAGNIIVDHSKADDCSFSLKIIGLGSAVLVEKNEAKKQSIIDFNRQDLFSLGLLLYELFTGGDEAHYGNSRRRGTKSVECNVEESRSKKQQGTTNIPLPALHEVKFKGGVCRAAPIPRSISLLVSNLMEAADHENRFRSVKEVEDDLYLMLMDPSRFFFDPDPDRVSGELVFPRDKLYGREDHLSVLMEAYNRIISGGTAEMVLVKGYSGTGKSALVQHVREPVTETGGYFLSGKFDKLRQCEPLSAVIAAFTEYSDKVVKAGEKTVEITKSSIEAFIGCDTVVLTDLIPSLRRIVGKSVKDDNGAKAAGIKAQNRFTVIFRAFVRAIADSAHPVVLFLDDLQWADVASLELMKSLVSDAESKSFLFIGAYRDNEVGDNHPLSAQLQEIKKKEVAMKRIHVENMCKSDCNELISDTVCQTRRVTEPLTDIVFSKTGGNAFFVIQFLRSLVDDGLLRFNFDARAWRWDTKAIQSKDTADNAVDLLTKKILNLSVDTRRLLQVVSCIGSKCDDSTLQLITIDNTRLAKGLEVAVREGLMDNVGPEYKFVHDDIQHAAYSLIPMAQRGKLHLDIGKHIFERASTAQLEHLLFVAVDQLNRGAPFIRNKDEKTELAKINLRAGRKAIKSSTFLIAASYLNAGIEHLGPGHWEEHYDLSLELNGLCAEMEYCNGNFSVMGQLLEQIFKHARTFDDKLGAYCTLLHGLGAQYKMREAIETGFLVLEKLGELFPDLGWDENPVYADLMKTVMTNQIILSKDVLDTFSDNDFLTMRVMEDERKIAAMRFLYPMVLYTYVAKQEFLPMITFRMMQLSLTHGVCKESAIGFAAYGLITCGVFGDIQQGYRFGQIALSLLERFRDNDRLARVYSIVYAAINPWKQPLGLSVEPHLHAYQVGMRLGDVEQAMVNAHLYCCCCFQSGQPLPSVEKDMRKYCRQMIEYKQDMVLALTLPFRQAVMNLMGLSDDPKVLTGEAMDQEKMLKEVRDKKNFAAACFVFFLRMIVAYFYGDYELAAKMAQESRNIDELHPSRFENCNHVFFDGLISLALARKGKQKKWRYLAEKAISKMKVWAVNSPFNCQHKLALLEAEYAFLNKKYNDASEAFYTAITKAGENGFLQDQALAYERAALFHLLRDGESTASRYYDQAHTAYLEWGARGKADHIRRRSLSLLISKTMQSLF